MKHLVRAILSKLGYECWKSAYRPFGLNHAHDIIRFLDREDVVQVVFDVGANEGQSALEYVKYFLGAVIYSFEPVRNTFARLESNCRPFRSVRPFPLALGDRPGEVRIELAKASVQNSLCRRATGPSEETAETVKVDTVDRFAKAHGIERIDLLKTDTEGFDLQVLMGAEAMLSSGAVRFVLSEVTFNPRDSDHSAFGGVFQLLSRHGFGFVDLYDHDYVSFSPRKPPLAYCNALFYRPFSQDRARGCPSGG